MEIVRLRGSTPQCYKGVRLHQVMLGQVLQKELGQAGRGWVRLGQVEGVRLDYVRWKKLGSMGQHYKGRKDQVRLSQVEGCWLCYARSKKLGCVVNTAMVGRGRLGSVRLYQIRWKELGQVTLGGRSQVAWINTTIVGRVRFGQIRWKKFGYVTLGGKSLVAWVNTTMVGRGQVRLG